jgi:RNA polymerase sigma-32 factor
MNRTTKADASPLDTYLRQIQRVALLTRDEEQRLARAFRDRGDLRAGHRLVEANLRFVVKIAFEYRRYGLAIPDLIQEGNLGLMKGVQKFDPDRDVRLVSYAVWWIRAYIQGHVLKSWSLVKVGTTQAQRKLFFSLARARREIELLTLGAKPDGEGTDADLVAKRLDVTSSEVVEMEQRLAGRDVSLEAPVGDGTSTRLDALGSGAEPQDEELARREEEASVARRVAAAIGRLDARERHIVEARIMGDGRVTLRDLGGELGFSRERARQLEARGLEKLRRELRPLADEVGWTTPPRRD